MNANRANRLAGLFTVIALVVLGLGAGFYMAGLKDDGGGKPQKVLQDYLNDGQKYYDRGNYREAIVSYQKAVSMDGASSEALMGLGNAYAVDADYENAEKTYRDVLAADPSNADACVELAQILLQQGKLAEAKELVDSTAAKVQDERLMRLKDQMTVEDPAFDIPSGTYDSYQLLRLSNPRSGSVVYYTTDGSEPDEYCRIFGEAVVISEPHTVLRAKAYNALGYSSGEISAEYSISVPAQTVPAEGDMREALNLVLGKSYSEEIYNYELAQLRDIYLVGRDNSTQEQLQGAVFSGSGYQIGNRASSGRGNLQSLSFLAYCPYVRSVNIAYQNHLSLDGLQYCPDLESLSLVNCGVTDITAVSSLKGLKRLSLGQNDVEDISPVSGLTGLEYLGLWNNRIQDISPLAGLVNLTCLNVSGNWLNSADELGGLVKLRELWLRENQISDLSFTDSLPELRVLMAGKNPVSNYGKLEMRVRDFYSTDLTE